MCMCVCVYTIKNNFSIRHHAYIFSSLHSNCRREIDFRINSFSCNNESDSRCRLRIIYEKNKKKKKNVKNKEYHFGPFREKLRSPLWSVFFQVNSYGIGLKGDIEKKLQRESHSLRDGRNTSSWKQEEIEFNRVSLAFIIKPNTRGATLISLLAPLRRRLKRLITGCSY